MIFCPSRFVLIVWSNLWTIVISSTRRRLSCEVGYAIQDGIDAGLRLHKFKSNVELPHVQRYRQRARHVLMASARYVLCDEGDKL